MVPTGSMQCAISSGMRDSDTLSTFESDCTEAERASKKQKVLHVTSIHAACLLCVHKADMRPSQGNSLLLSLCRMEFFHAAVL